MDKEQVQSQEEPKVSEQVAEVEAQDVSVEEKLQQIYDDKHKDDPPEEKPAEPEAAPEPVAAEAKAGDVPRGTEAPVPFVPNTKFKVHGKELEFDDFVHDIVTNEERQNKLRELYEKAHGLDHIKPKYQEAQEKFRELQGNYDKLDQGINALDAMVKRGSYDEFFKSLGIPKENVYQWVVDQVKYQQAPPEQRQQIDAQRTSEQQAWINQTRLEQLEQQTYNQKTDFLQREMDLVLGQNEVKTFAERYDQKAGENAFFNLVKEVGVANYEKSGTELTAKQAIDKAIAVLKPVMGEQEVLPQQTPAPVGQQAPPQLRQKPKVIPNVQGGATSPVAAKKVRSVEDLENIYEEKYGTN